MNRLNSEEEALQALLEGAGPDDAPQELRRMARMLSVLQAEQPAPRPGFREAVRARILAEPARRRPMAERLREAWLERNAAWRRSLRAVVAMASVASLLLGGGAMFAAAHKALPGQRLYHVKLLREDLVMSFTRGAEHRGLRHLQFAANRNVEVRRLAEAGVREDQLYVVTLERMDGHVVRGSELLIRVAKEDRRRDLLRRLKGFAEAQAQDLKATTPLLPVGARPRAADSLALLESVDQRANDLLRGCPCPENVLVRPKTPPEEPAAEEEPSGPSCPCEEPVSGGLGPAEEERPPSGGTPQEPSAPTPPEEPDTIPPVGVAPVDDLVDQTAEEIIEDLLKDLPPASPEEQAGLPLPQASASETDQALADPEGVLDALRELAAKAGVETLSGSGDVVEALRALAAADDDEAVTVPEDVLQALQALAATVSGWTSPAPALP